MSKKICIFFLTGAHRFEAFPLVIEQLSQIKNINDIHLLLLTNDGDSTEKYTNILNNTKLSYNVESFPSDDNYMRKVKFALEFGKTNNIPYLMKHDNDILCPSFLYDFLFENTELLDNEKNLLLTPTLTSGIPTVEQFLHDFCSEEERKAIYSQFLQCQFGQIWGVDYSHLNQHTTQTPSWDPRAFFQSVKEASYYYKGVHPVRLYDKAIYALNELVLKKKKTIFQKREASFVYDSASPYFCNSIFLVRRDLYEMIVNAKNLYVDPFDEVPLNRFRDILKANILYTKNAAAIHIIYNSIPNNDIYEKKFVKKFLEEHDT